MEEYTDRLAKNINLRKLKVYKEGEEPKEYLVSIEQAEEDVVEKGTPINAELFNGWQRKITDISERVDEVEALSKVFVEQPDCEEANEQGEAKVEIINGQLKFSCLKGEPGEKYAITEAKGKYAFYINEKGELCLKYNDEDFPNKAPENFVIEDGFLKYKID